MKNNTYTSRTLLIGIFILFVLLAQNAHAAPVIDNMTFPYNTWADRASGSGSWLGMKLVPNANITNISVTLATGTGASNPRANTWAILNATNNASLATGTITNISGTLQGSVITTVNLTTGNSYWIVTYHATVSWSGIDYNPGGTFIQTNYTNFNFTGVGFGGGVQTTNRAFEFLTVNSSAINPTAAPTFFALTAANASGQSLLNFNATINGTNYTTTNGTIQTLLNQTPITQVVNITVTSYFYLPTTILNVNTSSNLQVNLSQFAQAKATDLYDNSSINTFTVEYSGTNYTTTNGTLWIPVNTSTYNPIVYSPNYFNQSYTGISRTSIFNATIYQAVATFAATETISNSTISGFTVTAPNGVWNASSTPILYLKAGTYTIWFNKTGWFNKTTAINVSAVTNYTYNLTDEYQYLLNVTLKNSTGSSITSFNANVSTSAYNNTYSTSNGSIIANWYNSTGTVLVYNGTFADTTGTFNLSASSTPVIYNISLTALTYNTFNLTFYNESSNNQLIQNFTVQIISSLYANNYTAINGKINISFLTPGDYEIRYWWETDVPRSYYVTLSDGSYNSIRLYSVDAAISNVYIPIELNPSGSACNNNTVSLLRYYTDINGYRIVSMAKTDTNGNAVLRVVPNIIPYKLVFSGGCGDFTSDPQQFTATTNSFTVSNAQSPLTSILGIQGVSQSLIFNNVTNTFIFTWADTNNLITSGCMVINEYKLGVLSTPSSNCSDTPSGSLVYTVTDTNQTSYTATVTLHTDSTFSSYTDTLSQNFADGFRSWGLTGIFITVLVVIAFAFMSLGSAETTVMGAVGAIVFLGLFGILAYNYTVVVGILIVVGIVIYKTKG